MDLPEISVVTGVEIGLAAAALILLTLVVWVWVRRRRIARGGSLVVCALRNEAEPHWRLGLLRLGRSLDWFSVVGSSTRPEYSWSRAEVDLGAPTPLAEAIPGLTDPMLVEGTVSALRIDLALPRSGATAVRVWLESSPPSSASSRY